VKLLSVVNFVVVLTVSTSTRRHLYCEHCGTHGGWEICCSWRTWQISPFK